MRIEKGVCPNCSELVARLYPAETEDELHELLHELEKVTDWTVGIQAAGGFPRDFDDVSNEVKSCLLGEEEERTEIGKTVSIEDVEFGNLYHKDKEIVYDPERLEEPYSRFFRENSWSTESSSTRVFLLKDLEKNDIKIGDQTSGLEITQDDGYCHAEEVLLEALQHSYSPHFEPMAKAISAFDTGFHCHDGGSPRRFETYCEKNGFTDVRRRTFI